MESTSTLYQFSQETKDKLRKFRLGTSRAQKPQATICAYSCNPCLATRLTTADMIDSKTQEIKPADEDTYTDMLELADELPDSSPRFILLSYPLTLVPIHVLYLLTPTDLSQPSGRLSVPYVMIYFLPVNCNPNLRMSYAGAVELMRSTAEVSRVIEIHDPEELGDIEKKLQGED